MAPQSPDEIARYYQETPEEDRLAAGRGPLESERTREIALRCLPRPAADILDIGGAAGHYALWLAGLGYRVHLLDASPRLVQEARRRSDAATHPIARQRDDLLRVARALEREPSALGLSAHLLAVGTRT